MIRHLDVEAVQLDGEVGKIACSVAEGEGGDISYQGVRVVSHGVEDLLGLVGLDEAARVGDVHVALRTEEVASSELEERVVGVGEVGLSGGAREVLNLGVVVAHKAIESLKFGGVGGNLANSNE